MSQVQSVSEGGKIKVCAFLLGSRGEPISWPFLVAWGCLPFVARGLSFHCQQHPSHLSLLPSQSLMPPSFEGPYDDTEAIQATQDNLTTSHVIQSAKPLASCQVTSSLVPAVSMWPSLGAIIPSTTQGTDWVVAHHRPLHVPTQMLFERLLPSTSLTMEPSDCALKSLTAKPRMTSQMDNSATWMDHEQQA